MTMIEKKRQQWDEFSPPPLRQAGMKKKFEEFFYNQVDCFLHLSLKFKTTERGPIRRSHLQVFGARERLPE
jgi:hypothetical protein